MMNRLKNLKQKLELAARLKTCEFVDFKLLPLYKGKREELFQDLGITTPPMPTDEPVAPMAISGEPLPESVNPETVELPTDPNATTLEILTATISSTEWTQADTDNPMNNSEYFIVGSAMQLGPHGEPQIVVFLQDKFSQAKQPVPLYVLLQNFKPIQDFKVRQFHA